MVAGTVMTQIIPVAVKKVPVELINTHIKTCSRIFKGKVVSCWAAIGRSLFL